MLTCCIRGRYHLTMASNPGEARRKRIHLTTGALLAGIWLSTAFVDVPYYAVVAYGVLFAGIVAWLAYAVISHRSNR